MVKTVQVTFYADVFDSKCTYNPYSLSGRAIGTRQLLIRVLSAFDKNADYGHISNMKATYPERRNGFEAMEKLMDGSPLKRALRKFTAGRPVEQPVDTPLGAVVFAVEQRDRLQRLLKGEGVVAAISTEIITRLKLPGLIGELTEDTALNEGSMYTALRELESHVQEGGSLIVSGLVFVIETAGAKDVASYTLDRTPEGCAVLLAKTEEVRGRLRAA
jgi:hypothetical protein